MVKGHILHSNGYLGENMTIALLDAGYKNADKLPIFNSLWTNNQILGIRDFEEHDKQVFDNSSHGTMVFSVLAGNIPGVYVGTAPNAKYWLLRTEVGGSEYLSEEYNWIAAAEFADSAGVDIINSSLGYTTFNDSTLNHSQQDLDGRSIPVSKAAALAASKGMIVVNSAGNQGDDKWQYISAPADADSIISVGSVGPDLQPSFFTSTGPTFDGRIKPDLAAQGFGIIVQNSDSTFLIASGTSFSAPVISGLVACLWQKYPELSNIELMDKIFRSAHHYSSPDTLTGYGIPNFSLASGLSIDELSTPGVEIYPNPFQDHFFIRIPVLDPEGSTIYLEIFELLGREIYKREFSTSISGTQLCIDTLSNWPSGIYFIKLTIATETIIKQKLLKL
jgi:subtilisin family serine protease